MSVLGALAGKVLTAGEWYWGCALAECGLRLGEVWRWGAREWGMVFGAGFVIDGA